jgi:hypothetical protein
MRTKGKRAILKGHFVISTQELHDAVAAAERDTKARANRKDRIRSKDSVFKAETREELEGDSQEELDTDTEDCIIVNVN